MYIFGSNEDTRGCFMPIAPDTSDGRGAQLDLPQSGRIPDASLETPFLVTNITFSEQEKFHVSSCFGGRNYTYAFGHDPMRSNCTVQFMGFLRSTSGDDSGVLGTMLKHYRDSRLSMAYENPAKIRVADNKVMKGFINSIQSSTAQTETSVQSFKMNLMIVEAQ